ncbi:MAG: SIR2 family protein [Vicingaceae bacterium]
MSDKSHDPAEYIRGIQQILISDKKRIGFLFGAGSSLANEELIVPAIGQMTTSIVKEIGTEKKEYKSALDEIKIELGEDKFNIETILSNLELKASFIGNSKLNKLEKKDFEDLIKNIKTKVRKAVSVHRDDKTGKIVPIDKIENLVHTDFAKWIGQAERKYPIELFTTNYDFLFELGLECKEVPYYDGFCGSLRPFFNPESVEDFAFLNNQTKLWKIHGSLGWHYDKETEKILRVDPDDDDILIYPSSLKYKDSKKQPYESLLDRLSNFLKQDDSILITCGYSWGDEHINSRIISSLKTNTTSHVIGLIFDKGAPIKSDSKLAKLAHESSKISLFGSKGAIIGCKYGDWMLKTEPSNDDTVLINFYFDEDAPIEDSDEPDKDLSWTGKGDFILPDFAKLVRFLNEMISENEIKQLGKKAIKLEKDAKK